MPASGALAPLNWKACQFSVPFPLKPLRFQRGERNRIRGRRLYDEVRTRGGLDREERLIAAALALSVSLLCGSSHLLAGTQTGNEDPWVPHSARTSALSEAKLPADRKSKGAELAPYPGVWPRLMPASAAAAYVGERSVESFRRSSGKLWPTPVKIPGKGDRWLKEELDEAINRLSRRPYLVRDAADVL